MKLIDTIAAVSTPRGKGGVAMIRISGADAQDIADRVFKTASGAPLSAAPSALMRRGTVISPEDGCAVDDGMAALFRAPASFTGEDTVEIYCHGGALVTERVLSCVLCAGARYAQAGEFTRRAFVNGKIGLDEAESLGALLEAKTHSQLRLARNGMSGTLAASIRDIYESLRSVLTGVYAAIDFPDEDLNEFSREQMIELLSRSAASVDSLIATYKTGRAVSEGISTVICGRANAGKSSVYNAIVGYDAAIVTDIEGTTRDVLKQVASLGDVTLSLADTAGIRDTADRVESIGVARALRELEGAELILAVFDGSCELGSDDLDIIERLGSTTCPCVAIINKSDLGVCQQTADVLSSRFEHTVVLSAADRQGFDRLAQVVRELFLDGSIDLDNDAVVSNARQFSSLTLAKESLSSAIGELVAGTPLDLSCIAIESALSFLGEVDGRELGEQIVSEIFSKFCVGK